MELPGAKVLLVQLISGGRTNGQKIIKYTLQILLERQQNGNMADKMIHAYLIRLTITIQNLNLFQLEIGLIILMI